ncbi:MAG TPA: type II toxin-antitoxin system VapC family toxin, partial [Burkholderiaceae bacterium]|nr:type II toxin-antitoxin system VapC family toxin [Burkholderiaceae bacterium]
MSPTQALPCAGVFQLNGSDRAEELLRSDDHLIAPDLVIAEITNAAWKFVIFERIPAQSALSAVREVVKAFEELVPVSVLKDRALAIAIELRHPTYDCFYLRQSRRQGAHLCQRESSDVAAERHDFVGGQAAGRGAAHPLEAARFDRTLADSPQKGTTVLSNLELDFAARIDAKAIADRLGDSHL